MLRIVNTVLLCLLLTACAQGSAERLQKLGDDLQRANSPNSHQESQSPPNYQCTQNGPFTNCQAI